MLRILFVDDEEYYALAFLDALKAHFNVQYVRHPDGAIRMINEQKFDGIVLDIRMMLPTGGRKEVLDDGNFSGLWVLHKCEDKLTRDGTRICILTNVNLARVRGKIQDFEIKIPDHQLQLSAKGETTARFFPLDLETFLRRPAGGSGDEAEGPAGQ